VALTIGIVGLPNAGKSTLFNALTKNDVLAANYPFATIEPNVGVVGVPDERLDKLAEIFGSARLLPATVEFVDIAGIVAGASQGEGLGNKFLSHIRESAAICQVTRVFRDEDVTHVDGRVDPASDITTIQTELMLADLQTVEKAIPRLEKEARNNKDAVAVLAAAKEAKAALDEGTPIIATKIDREALRELSLMTAKPYLFVFNCDSDELFDGTSKTKCGRSWPRPRPSSWMPSSRPNSLNSAMTLRLWRCCTRWAWLSLVCTNLLESPSTPSVCRPT